MVGVAGIAVTVILWFTLEIQPLGFTMVYLIVAVPALLPLTKPVAFTVAIPAILTQLPPALVLLSWMVLPTHKLDEPKICEIGETANTVIEIKLLNTVVLVIQLALLVKLQLNTSPFAKLTGVYIEAFAPTIFTPFFLHWYTGFAPPFVIVEK